MSRTILVVVGVIGVVARILQPFSSVGIHSCFNNAGEPKHYHAIRPPVYGDQAGYGLLGDRHRGQPVRVRRDDWQYRRVLGYSPDTVAVILRRGHPTRSPSQASNLQEVGRQGYRTHGGHHQSDRAPRAD
ncbi:unnamed protein product [Ectocarpus fasciculatus]